MPRHVERNDRRGPPCAANGPKALFAGSPAQKRSFFGKPSVHLKKNKNRLPARTYAGRANTLQLRDIVTAMKWQIPVWAVVLVGVIGLAGLYYLARTGHETSVSVSTAEIMIRNELEELLLARPRTKEFLVAFPGIMLAVYCAVRRLPFWTALFGLAGTIGLTSICNTFMHIRTPLYLGFIRTGYSLLFGIVIGCVMILCFDLLYKWYRKYLKKYMETERK